MSFRRNSKAIRDKKWIVQQALKNGNLLVETQKDFLAKRGALSQQGDRI